MALAVSDSSQAQVAGWAGDRISELMGQINAATSELVGVIATVLEADAWDGRTPEVWVVWRCGISPSRARGLVAMARRRADLPVLVEAFSAGRMSEDAVRVASRFTPAARDAEVADLASAMTVSQLTRVLRSLPVADTAPADPPDEEVSFGSDDDGSWSLRAAHLSPERGALVGRALEAAREAEFVTRHPEAAEGSRPQGVTWADALVRMASAALDALDPASGGGRSPSERYGVLVHIREQDGVPVANVHLGPALSASARRHITCDTSLRWVLERDGRPVSWGRRRRTVNPVLRRLIEDRDRGCRVPGCTQVRWLEVHHLRHVEDGGETVPDNLACLCPTHHRAHHGGELGISGDPTHPDGLVFTTRSGPRLHPPPPTPPGAPPPAPPASGFTPPASGFTPPDYGHLDYGMFAWN